MLAVGPTTAIFRTSFRSGNTPSFLSSTIDARAASSARARCSGDALTLIGICA